MTDTVYIRNKQRARAAVNNRMRASHRYQPEYVKHDIKPVPRTPVDLSDNLYSQRDVTKRKPIEQPAPRRYVVRDASQPPAPPRPMAPQVSVGNNHDHTWYEEEPNEPIMFDDVPSPPQSEFAQAPPERDQYVRTMESPEFMANTVTAGDYCVVVRDEVVWTSSNLEEIEEAVQIILYERKAATLAELSVFKRLPIKIGVSVRNE